MEKLALADLDSIAEYEQKRDSFQKKINAEMRRRSRSLGPDLTINFENREIVRLYLQEMIRAQRARQAEKVQQIIKVYNDLIPESNELTAVLFLNFRDKTKIQPLLKKFSQLTVEGSLEFISSGGDKIPGKFHSNRSQSMNMSPLYNVRFRISEDGKRLLENGDVPVNLVLHYRKFTYECRIDNELRLAMLEDIAG